MYAKIITIIATESYSTRKILFQDSRRERMNIIRIRKERNSCMKVKAIGFSLLMIIKFSISTIDRVNEMNVDRMIAVLVVIFKKSLIKVKKIRIEKAIKFMIAIERGSSFLILELG
jgi:hypothetical protein